MQGVNSEPGKLGGLGSAQLLGAIIFTVGGLRASNWLDLKLE